MLRLLQDVAEEVVNPRFRSLSSGEIDEKGPGDLVTAGTWAGILPAAPGDRIDVEFDGIGHATVEFTR